MTDYRAAGVDLDAADRMVDSIRDDVTATWSAGVIGSFGGFAAGLALPPGFRDPILMLSTDGVGTKAELARATGMVDTLGEDLVAMCVDDLAAAGARPIAMSDYISMGSNDESLLRRLVSGIARGCSVAGCSLVGGETAIHPDTQPDDAFDLAGTALGIVERDEVIDGSAITSGDALVGLHSPNARSNGYSLIRNTVLKELDLQDQFPGSDQTTAEVLLAPSVIYAPSVLKALKSARIHGLVHVTGGGIAGNLLRVLPEGTGAAIDTSSWKMPDVFDVIATVGRISTDEMYRVFNMGVGFIVVTPDPDAVIASVAEHNITASVIGEATEDAAIDFI